MKYDSVVISISIGTDFCNQFQFVNILNVFSLGTDFCYFGFREYFAFAIHYGNVHSIIGCHI